MDYDFHPSIFQESGGFDTFFISVPSFIELIDSIVGGLVANFYSGYSKIPESLDLSYIKPIRTSFDGNSDDSAMS